MGDTDLWVHAELAARDRGWAGDPERAAWSKQADHLVRLAGRVGWLAILFGSVAVGRRPYGSVVAGLATAVVLWRLAQTTEDHRAAGWFCVGAVSGLVAAGSGLVAVVTLWTGSILLDGGAAWAAFFTYAVAMALWSRASGWPQSGRRFARAAVVLVVSVAAMGVAVALAGADLAAAPEDSIGTGIYIGGHKLTGAASTLGGIGSAGLLVGVLLIAYANAGISQVHRPPPWWRRRRSAARAPSQPDHSVLSP